MIRLLPYLLSLALCGQALAGVSMDPYGWTVITPSQDSRIVYVSSSQGNDSNNGLSPQTPKKTVAAANSLIRDGYPDHMLLKRGDTFSVGNQDLGRWKNGRSAQEPLLISGYGEGPRPIIHLSGSLVHHAGQMRDYQAFIGLDLYKPYSDPDSPLYNNSQSSTALDFTGGGDTAIVEDCRFRFTGAIAQSIGANVCSNFSFRRNIVTDNWCYDSSTTDAHVNGLYVDGVDGYIIEENFFDHCGWNEEIPGAGANMYAHNMYIQFSNKAGGIMRGNISTRSSAHGMQARSGGVVERNLFALNAVGVNMGGVADPKDSNVYTFNNRIIENVVINGRLMDPNNTNWPRTSAIFGIDSNNHIPGALVEDNIVANRIHSGSNQSYLTSGNPVMIDNISYKWANDTPVNPNWPHPDDDLGDYYASIGGTNSTTDYLHWLRNRPEGSLPWEMTAYAAINYIRAGFSKSPISGYYQYDGGTGTVPVTGVNLVPSSISLEESQTQQLTATVSPANATNPSVSWSSNNTSVATVNSAGLVTAVAAGNATITVTTNDGSYTDTTSVTVTAGQGGPDPEGNNVALGASVTVSDYDGNSGSNLVDGDTGDEARWSAQYYPQWAEIDLGGVFAVEEIRVHPLANRDYQYEVEASIDGVNYGVIVDRSANTTSSSVISDSFSPVSARYIRITITGAHTYPYEWVSLREVEVIGEPVNLENLALGANVTVSDYDGNSGSNLVDGDTSDEARWSAQYYPQWAEIDLGGVFAVEEIRVHPLANRDYQYEVEASIDGVNYGVIVDRSANTTSSSVISDSFSPVSARYIRINITGAHTYPYEWVSLREVEVIGSALAEQNVALGATVTDSANDGHVGANIVDGDLDPESRWSALGYSQWVLIDLGATYAVEEIIVHPFQDRAYQYEVEASLNGSQYSTIVDRTSNTTGGSQISDPISPTSARYIRITITGASGYTGGWSSLREVEVISAGSN